MGPVKFFGMFSIIQATLILTISFFVLFAMRKIEEGKLKAFGYVIAVLLWISAAMVFFMSICPMLKCSNSGMSRMEGMKMKSDMSCPMMKPDMKDSAEGKMPDHAVRH